MRSCARAERLILRTASSRVRSPAASSTQNSRIRGEGISALVNPRASCFKRRTVNLVAHRLRCLARPVAAQFHVRHCRDFNVNVNAVEQRAADLAQITLYRSGVAPAFARGIAVEPARARIHGRDQHEARGETKRHVRSRNGDRTFFEWLPQQLENVARKLWKFVQEQ